MQIRVLVLGDDSVSLPRHRFPGVDVVLTRETSEEIMSGGRYMVSSRSLELARTATPDMYDAIIIGNNLGTGLPKAHEVPEAMRDRTMIVWNHYSPGNEHDYAKMGFTRFGQRLWFDLDDAPKVYCIKDFLEEVAAAKQSAAVQ